LVDRLDDAFHEVGLSVVGREPEHLATLGLEPALTSLVVPLLLVGIVAGTVQLDDEAGGGAVEVNDVFADGMLPAELPPFEPAASQVGPEPALGARHVVPQGPGAFGSEFVAHRCTIRVTARRG
jgi:hypothetical protein